MTESSGLTLGQFVVVRTPLLPFRAFRDLASGARATAVDSPDEQGLRANVRDALYEAFRDPLLDESLRVASSSLHKRYRKALTADGPAANPKLERSLMKYFARMTSRCTPFGLLAGVSCCSIDERKDGPTGIELQPTSQYRRHSRIDMGIVSEVGRRLLQDPTARRSLRYFLNPTIHKRGSRWHYIEARPASGAYRFEMSSVHGTPYLDSLIEALNARPGDRRFSEIAGMLAAIEPDADAAEVDAFVDRLIEDGVMLSELVPPLTEGEPVPHIGAALDGDACSATRRDLLDLQAQVEQLNAAPLGGGLARLERLEAGIRSLLGDDTPKNLVQIDMHKPAAHASIPRRIIDDIREAVDALLLFSPGLPAPLETFKREFLERYGESPVEVPLLEALDPDGGLAWARVADRTPLLDGLNLPDHPAPASQQQQSAAATLLMREFERACREGRDELVLSRRQISKLRDDAQTHRQLPDSFFVSATMVGEDTQRHPARVVIRACGGASAVQLMARFCPGDDELTAHVKSFLEEEQSHREDCVYAEIVHWPLDRVSNVILRPRLREKELPIFGRSLAYSKDTIHASDLLVSVVGEEIVLRCRRSGKRILPRLASAHNTSRNSVALYRFFGYLQLQDATLTAFNWPPAITGAKELPRIRYGNCILAPRTWYLTNDDLKPLARVGSEQAAARIHDWAERLRWPRFVELAVGDNHLCVDMRNSLSVDCLLAELKKSNAATIQESFVPPEGSFVHGPEGGFSHEILLPFLRSRSAGESRGRARMHPSGPTEAGPPPGSPSTGAPRRLALPPRPRHLPGGTWLSMKIYCGTMAGERMLIEHLHPLIRQFVAEELVVKWFFLRYRDPEPHLRMRLNGDPARLWGGVAARIHDVLNESHDEALTWRVTFDTYQPEIERYGGPEVMSLAESVFHVDNECAAELVSQGHMGDPDQRWKWIAFATEALWRAAGFDIKARHELYENFGRSKAPDKPTKIAVDRKYRALRKELRNMLLSDSAPAHPAEHVIERRTRQIGSLLAQQHPIMKQSATGPRPLAGIISSHAHMRINRLCVSAAPAQERTIYELLERLLRSELARGGEPMGRSASAHLT